MFFSAVWNALPYIVTGLLFTRAKLNQSRRVFWGAVAFLMTGQLLVIVVHLAWFLDLDGFQTGSSTSGLVLFFGQLWALLIGTAAYYAVYFVTREHSEFNN